MNELKFAIHIHTTYSDGNATHQELINAAQLAGLDGIIITDHNIWLDGLDGYYGEENKESCFWLAKKSMIDPWTRPVNMLVSE